MVANLTDIYVFLSNFMMIKNIVLFLYSVLQLDFLCIGGTLTEDNFSMIREYYKQSEITIERVTARTPYPMNTFSAARRSPSTILLSLESLR